MRQFSDVLADRERGGEAWGFDAEEIDDVGDAVVAGAVDAEVGGGFARAGDFWADACVGWDELAVGELGPEAADCRVEALGSIDVDVVVERFDPFDVGAKTRLICQIDREVNAQAAGFGDRIHEVMEISPPRKPEVMPAGVVRRRHVLLRKSFDAARDLGRMQTGTIYDRVRA